MTNCLPAHPRTFLFALALAASALLAIGTSASAEVRVGARTNTQLGTGGTPSEPVIARSSARYDTRGSMSITTNFVHAVAVDSGGVVSVDTGTYLGTTVGNVCFGTPRSYLTADLKLDQVGGSIPVTNWGDHIHTLGHANFEWSADRTAVTIRIKGSLVKNRGFVCAGSSMLGGSQHETAERFIDYQFNGFGIEDGDVAAQAAGYIRDELESFDARRFGQGVRHFHVKCTRTLPAHCSASATLDKGQTRAPFTATGVVSISAGSERPKFKPNMQVTLRYKHCTKSGPKSFGGHPCTIRKQWKTTELINAFPSYWPTDLGPDET
jgi:hypothetical protein